MLVRFEQPQPDCEERGEAENNERDHDHPQAEERRALVPRRLAHLERALAEIAAPVRGELVGGAKLEEETRSSGVSSMWTAPPRREPAPYFFRHRCVRLCVCVFVYSIVCACTLE